MEYITYFNSPNDFEKELLKVGDNHYQGDGYSKTINVVPIWESCYRIRMTNWTKTTEIAPDTTWNGLIFSFNDSVSKNETPRVQIRLTSKDNYNPFFGNFYDGNEFTYTLAHGEFIEAKIQPEKFLYLDPDRHNNLLSWPDSQFFPKKWKCRQESFYHDFLSLFNSTHWEV